MSFEDNFQHKGLRRQLVEELRNKGIKDEQVLLAINRVPRHVFMDSGFIKFSYKDQAFPIGEGQTISQPYTVAFQTELLGVKPMDKVLEIGTGSGYQTAVLLEMGAKVYSIERHKPLFQKASKMMELLSYKPYLFYGDGFEGKPTYGPYDKVLITAAAPEIPQKLLLQLKKGGRLVLPLGAGSTQIMVTIDCLEDGSFVRKDFGLFSFVPMLKGTQ
jgi:protein-L-isoaspartate(D-aspartate) O-methyltransferase